MSTATKHVLAQSAAANSIVIARQDASVSLADFLAAQLRDALGAIDTLSTQVHQMKGMFDDEDGAITAALEEAQEAIDGARPAIARYEAEKDILPAAVIMMEGGCIQYVATNQPTKLLFLDYDTEGSQEDELTLVTEWPPGNPTERQDIAHAFEYGNGDQVRPDYVNARLEAWAASDGARC